MANTEKPSTIAEKKKQAVATPKQKVVESQKIPETKKTEESKKTEQPKDVKKPEKKKKEIKKVKKSEVVVNGKSLPISTKYAMAICKFVKNKEIETAIRDLEQVLMFKKAVPMKGEIPHRKGKIMSGRFPKKATENFIVLLKSLMGNANNHELNEPVIAEAIANIAQRPYGRFGRVRKKRTHVTLKAREKKSKEKKK